MCADPRSYLSIDDLRYIVTSDGNPLSGQDLEEFLQEADIFKNGVVVRGASRLWGCIAHGAMAGL